MKGRVAGVLLGVWFLLSGVSWAGGYSLMDDLGFWLRYRYHTLEQKELPEFIEKKGLDGARFFFSDVDRWLTFDVREYLHDWHVRVRLLALRYRDLKHRPDPVAVKVLKEYAKKVAQGEKITPRVIVDHQKGGLVYRYFIPIYTKKSCLSCHGNPYQLAPSYAREIKVLYPEDQAIGFKEGDLQGVISLEIPSVSVKFIVSTQ